MLFREQYPTEYQFFKDAFQKAIASHLTTEQERNSCLGGIADLDKVAVVKKCECGQPTCATFYFADFSQREPDFSFDIAGVRETVVLDFDKEGRLIGAERAPDP